MDKRKNYILILDVETANGLNDPLVYDLGGVVADKQGNIYERFSLIISDIFFPHDLDLMKSAYYNQKLPTYYESISNHTATITSFLAAHKYILNLLKEYNIKNVAAYNAHFDINALNTTMRYITKSRKRYFFPYSINTLCIWNMACQTICQQKSYKRFCEENQLINNGGRNYSTTAETVYKYLTLQKDFEEEHRGLQDVIIETYIFQRSIATKRKYPNGKGIRRNCWQQVKRAV